MSAPNRHPWSNQPTTNPGMNYGPDSNMPSVPAYPELNDPSLSFPTAPYGSTQYGSAAYDFPRQSNPSGVTTGYGTGPSGNYGNPPYGANPGYGSNPPSNPGYGTPGYGQPPMSSSSINLGYGQAHVPTSYGNPGYGQAPMPTSYGNPGYGQPPMPTSYENPRYDQSPVPPNYPNPGYGQPPSSYGNPGYGAYPSATPSYGDHQPGQSYKGYPQMSVPHYADPTRLCSTDSYQAWFKSIDTNGSGLISISELQCGLINSDGRPFTQKICEQLINRFSTRSNHSINFNDFVRLQQFVTSCSSDFARYSRGGSTICQSDFLQQFRRFRPELTDNFASYWFGLCQNSMKLDMFTLVSKLVFDCSEIFNSWQPDYAGNKRVTYQKFMRDSFSVLHL